MGIDPSPAVNGEFVSEGTFLAIPACFPGVSLPPPAGELRMRGLQISSNGKEVFVLTHGPCPHVLQFLPKGSHGYAVDLGRPDGAVELTALIALPGGWADTLLLAGLSETGAFLSLGRAAAGDPGIQEWSVHRKKAAMRLDLPVSHISGITSSGDRILAWGDGQAFFLRRDAQSLSLEKAVSFRSSFEEILIDGRLLTSEFELFAIDWAAGTLFPDMRLECPTKPVTCLQAFPGGVVCADGQGTISEMTGDGCRVRGRIPWLPVHSLCRLPDGRIYASAGSDIAHWIVLENGDCPARDLGVPVSTLTARRYGFQFSRLLPGPDGEIYAAENDRGGHLWIYFPPYQPPTSHP